MTLRRLISLLAGVLVLLLAPVGAGTALAHQQKFTISTIALNPRSGMIEIVHQVPVHDAEHALKAQGRKNADIIASTKSREAFAGYVTRRFLLMINGDLVYPDYIGSEVTGGSLWVYQEVPAPAGDIRVRVNSQILTDVWARQENRINIGGGTNVTTFVFHAGDVPQAATLPR